MKYVRPLFCGPSIRLYGEGKDIADAAFGQDHPWCTWISLQPASQTPYLNIDASIEDVLVNPGRLSQLFTREGRRRGLKNREQRGISALTQTNLSTVGIH